jgi:WD40 repeat protein
MEELCYSINDRDLVLTLSNNENQILWKLLYQDYIPAMDSVPDGGMAVVRWSNDERYAYFFSFLNSSGGECFYDGGDRGFGLFRVDLMIGEITTVLPPSNSFWWYGFSFSPTDRRLVYGARAQDLKILDMTTGQLIRILSANGFDVGGGFLWSSDGLKLIYSTVKSWDQGEKFNYSLRLVDVQSGSEQILLESQDACYEAVAWTESNTLILEKNYNEALFEFDLTSNKIIGEVTATPFP